MCDQADVQIIATVSSPVLAPFELPSYRSQVLDVHYFPENRSLVVILAGGDIATVQLDSASGNNVRSHTCVRQSSCQVEIVGSVDSGIKAAAWSPDDEQLILVTGERKKAKRAHGLTCRRGRGRLYEPPIRYHTRRASSTGGLWRR